MAPVTVTVIQQGAPRVNADNAYVLHRGESVAAIVVDMASKRCDMDFEHVGEHGAPQVYLRATSESLHLDESRPVSEWTIIAFPEFVGWRVFVAEVCRYTLSVCLVRPVEDDAEGGL